jgi:hypothetical protein
MRTIAYLSRRLRGHVAAAVEAASLLTGAQEVRQ